MKKKEIVEITGNDLTLEDIVAVSRQYAQVRLHQDAVANIHASRKIVEDIVAQGRIVYGITTGFGQFCNKFIPREESKKLQRNLISCVPLFCCESITWQKDILEYGWKQFRQ